MDEEGDIGAVFESSDSSYGLISEYDSDLSKLRERFNYASIDCGANVLKANKESRGTSAILSESKDSYVLNKCSAEKHIIVELCYPILIDTIVLANFEFFSSTFKNVRVSVSKWYPPKEDWKVIGEYLARNSRELQVCLNYLISCSESIFICILIEFFINFYLMNFSSFCKQYHKILINVIIILIIIMIVQKVQ